MAKVLGNTQGNNGGRMYSFGMQPSLVDCSFIVDSTNGLGVSSFKGQGVQNVYMHTSGSPSAGNPNPLAGYALLRLSGNYNRLLGKFHAMVDPVTGSAINIDSTSAALVVGTPYIISSVGVGPKGAATIAPVADVAGSLASKYFQLYDSYGNVFIIWLSVSGVGSQPQLGSAAAFGQRGLQYVQQSILANATAAQIGAALVLTIQNLPSGISGVFSFTAAGTTTVTVTSTANLPLAGIPQDGASPLGTGFAFALTVSDTNLGDWNAVGLPRGLVPTVGQSFIAIATGAGASTGQVKAAGVSNTLTAEIVGDANLSLAPQSQGGSPNVGGWIMVKFLGLPSSGQVPAVTAPADGSVCKISFYLDARLSPSNL